MTAFLLPSFRLTHLLATAVMNIKRSKYNVDPDKAKRTHDGIVFDSILEMKYYRDVILPLSRSGEIVHYELQKEYVLQPKYIHNGKTIRPIIYVADFYIEYANGRSEVVDTKGCADSVANIKKKMFMYQYPDLPYRWITYVKKWGGWREYDEINRLRKEAKTAKGEEKERKTKYGKQKDYDQRTDEVYSRSRNDRTKAGGRML